MEQNVRNRLWEIAGREQVYEQEPMSRHTTFRIGGPADFFVAPADMEALAGLVSFCRQEEIPFYVMGNGSNLLVGDKGYRGVIIQVYKNLNRIEITENRIKAQAGAMLSAVARKALEHSLTGFEFASGIPGTLGGAVVMNAGAYGGEIKDVLVSATFLDELGGEHTIPAGELEMGHRTSLFAKKPWCIVSARFALTPGNEEEIRAKMDDFTARRAEKQPLDMPSAGSMFKRPPGAFAGALIDECGLRGFSVGGAAISEKHCGFVVNLGNATCADVIALTDEVRRIVQEKTGYVLEREVRVVK